MIYKLETKVNDGEPLVLHVKENMYMNDLIEYICAYYGFEAKGAYIDIPVAENMKRQYPPSKHAMIDEEIMPLFRYGSMESKRRIPDMEYFDAEKTKLMHAVEGIGDEMSLISGWNIVRMKIRGMTV